MIVARRVASWGVAPAPGVVLYTSGQARAAHITPKSSGGEAILALLAGTRLLQRAPGSWGAPALAASEPASLSRNPTHKKSDPLLSLACGRASHP